MSLSRWASAAVAVAVGAGVAHAQLGSDGSYPHYDATLTRLAIHQLPVKVAESTPVAMPLDQLTREKCDQKAIADLSKALQNAGYRREAAKALVAFSDTCGGNATSLRSAVNVLMDISDWATARSVASMVIKLEPFSDNGYFLRAVAADKAGDNAPAIADYQTAIELFGDKARISSVSYYNIARIYERMGRVCDAILPIQNWVAIDPSHDTSQTRSMIATYTTQGNCAAATAGKTEKFPAAKGNIVRVTATINGVDGTFILDTGASFVTISQAFARKAGIMPEAETMQMHTANGIVETHRARAKTVQLRSLRANDVVVAIQADKPGLGPGIDGLLGQSFLARYKVTLDAVNITIAP